MHFSFRLIASGLERITIVVHTTRLRDSKQQLAEYSTILRKAAISIPLILKLACVI